MIFSRRLPFLALALMGCASICLSRAEAPPSAPSIVRQVDHVMIGSGPAKELFALLTDTLQLPVAWPMSDYGSFGSGGVALGNVNLEILKAAPPAAGGPASRFVGLAFEPGPLAASVSELEARNLPHGPLAPYRVKQPNGSVVTLWTNVSLPDLSNNRREIFLCEYAHDVHPGRQRSLEQLRARNGGPLGVRSVREIVWGSTDLRRTEESWQKLLQPSRHQAGEPWQIGAGPALRAVAAERDEILEVVVNVQSLERARAFLKQNGLLGADRLTAVTLVGPPLSEPLITFVEEAGVGL